MQDIVILKETIIAPDHIMTGSKLTDDYDFFVFFFFFNITCHPSGTLFCSYTWLVTITKLVRNVFQVRRSFIGKSLTHGDYAAVKYGSFSSQGRHLIQYAIFESPSSDPTFNEPELITSARGPCILYVYRYISRKMSWNLFVSYLTWLPHLSYLGK